MGYSRGQAGFPQVPLVGACLRWHLSCFTDLKVHQVDHRVSQRRNIGDVGASKLLRSSDSGICSLILVIRRLMPTGIFVMMASAASDS